MILCQERASGPKAQLASSRVLVLAKRRQISVGSSLRARSPNLAKLSSLPCTQPTLPSVSSGCPKSRETRSHRLQPRQRAVLFGSRDKDGGEGHCSSRSGPRLVEGLSEGSGAPQDIVPSLFPGSPSSLAGPKLDELEDLQEKA